MRLIDADKIKLPQGFFEKVDNVPKFYEWLDKQPTVDAVEVVRCKDCKHWERDADFKDGWCRGERQYEDDFCSRGERRGEDGTD